MSIYTDAQAILQQALQACLQTLSPRKPEELDILWAKNSLELSKFWVSRPLWEKLCQAGVAETVGDFRQPQYDQDGYLYSFYR